MYNLGLEEVLDKKRTEYYKLGQEIRDLESQIISDKWINIPECDHDYYKVRDASCPYGSVHHGNIFCKNPNCHK